MANMIFTDEFQAIKSKEEKEKKLKSLSGGFSPWILCIDDDEDFLDLLKDEIEELGFRVKTVSRSQEAVAFIERHRSQMALILVDFSMPGRNGFEVREDTKEYSDIPFVILSGYVDREMALKGLELKVSSFLEKPYDSEKFWNVLQNEIEPRILQIKEDLELLSSFLGDADLIVEQIEEIFLDLEDQPTDRDLIQKAYGLLHTMKGSAGFFEPRTLHEFAHRFEDEIKLIHEGARSLNSDILSSWLKANDILKSLLEELRSGEASPLSLEEHVKVFDIEFEEKEVKKPTEPLAVKEAKGETEKVKEIRVAVSILDAFMMVSGEMTVIRNMINKAVQSLEKRYSSDKDVHILTELLGEMHKINADVQSQITDIRRVGVRSIVRPLLRTARDTARSLDKEIDLIVKGEDLRVDHSISEVLSHSLIHLIRNSIDHGMESKEERQMSGKEEKGKLLLEFIDSGDFIDAKISDDGKGIDVERLKSKALDKNLIPQEQLSEMSDEELFLLIFDAGFSTAEQVTQYSGRGVGLNMVKASVEELGGSIRVESARGKGTCFHIRVPVPKSATIASCLFVNIGLETFGIPRDFIEKVVRVSNLSHQDVNEIQGSCFLRHDGYLLPLVDFFPSPEKKQKLLERKDSFLLIIKTEKFRYCILVDNILDVEDSVIKDLQVGVLKQTQVYEGGTFLSDGRVGLVLSLDGIAEKNCLSTEIIKDDRFQGKQQLQDSSMERYLAFTLKGTGRCCIQEDEILRVEEIKRNRVQESGGWTLLPYHESIMYLVNTGSYFASAEPTPISLSNTDDEEYLKVIVLQKHDYFVGLVVDEVLGLEEVSSDLIPLSKPQKSCKGRLLVDGNSYCLMSLDPIMELVEEPSEGAFNDSGSGPDLSVA